MKTQISFYQQAAYRFLSFLYLDVHIFCISPTKASAILFPCSFLVVIDNKGSMMKLPHLLNKNLNTLLDYFEW